MSIEAMKLARGIISSINQSKQNALTVNDETVFWQREEWVRWALDEVLPVIDQAIEQAQKQEPDNGKSAPPEDWGEVSREEIIKRELEMTKRLAKAEQAQKQEPVMVDIQPPATQRDRWMYEQGRLAERDSRTHEDAAWGLAEKVREDLDRQSCPGMFMNLAMESIVKHYTSPPQRQPLTEAMIDEFLEDYEMLGEDEQGRDACYAPNENDKALIKDAVFGLLEFADEAAHGIKGEA